MTNTLRHPNLAQTRSQEGALQVTETRMHWPPAKKIRVTPRLPHQISQKRKVANLEVPIP
jgi:hypothetical protein